MSLCSSVNKNIPAREAGGFLPLPAGIGGLLRVSES